MTRTPDAFDSIYSKLNEIAAKIENQKQYGMWQLCPKCNGEGSVPGSHYNHDATVTINPICPVCNGARLLVRPEIKEEQESGITGGGEG